MRKREIRLVAVCVAGLVFAAAAPAQEGWINLFDKETLFGWTVLGNAQWEVANGAMSCKHVRNTSGWIATNSQFADFELDAKILGGGDKNRSTALVVRGGLEGHPSDNGSAMIPIIEAENAENAKSAVHAIHVTANGASITATVDGNPVEVLGGGRARGYIGVLYCCTGPVEVTEMKLRPLNLKPLFNGKDLEGWNTIPDHPSVFSVVDGAINIKNGNGQIETAGTYKDFLLQLDILSNGDKLNSGVFFRGPVGVFWKGYESQVRNEWRGDDRTKPVDFGTGGLYGDQEARKVVSSDRKWFQKTLVCEGNHIAVWIDGYQVTDWLDMRPVAADANGKGGYVREPGTIHLQGHDPTTDLSFKNIGVQAYPEK